MRNRFLRAFSALIAGTAFAVAVAGPAQWCACPTHGGDALAMAAGMHAAAAMEMPEMDSPAPASHGNHASHERGHQCTCPGGCTSTATIALQAAHVMFTVESLATFVSSQWPAATVELAANPTLSLPFAHAPPAVVAAQQDAALVTT